jgi:hypothetical protein
MRIIISHAGRGLLENTPPPPGGGGISADVIWGKSMKRGGEKCEKWRRKRGKM